MSLTRQRASNPAAGRENFDGTRLQVHGPLSKDNKSSVFVFERARGSKELGVFCRNCGHQNPEQNRFCGNCGNALAPERVAEPEYLGEKVPITMEQAAPEAARDVATTAELVDTRREPQASGPAAAVAEAPRHSGQGVEEKEITLSGPSFLGLSNTDPGEGDGYSYLFEEEQQSHLARWVLMVLLLVLGGVMYAKWQPIRDYVLTTSIAHSRPQQPPAQDTKNEPSSTADTSAPATPPAGSDAASQPAITPGNKTAQEAPKTDKVSSTAGKPDDSAKSSPAGASSEHAAGAAWKQPAAKSQAANDEASANPADDKGGNTAGEGKPSVAQKAPAPQDNAGGELVSSGERYLYGRGVARNCGQALSYFNAAAAKQNPQAFSHLGALYATGECVPMDRAVAYAWFRRAYAKEPSNRYFEQNLTMLWRAMTPRERQRAAGRQ